MDQEKKHGFGFPMPSLPSPKKEDLDIRIGDTPIKEFEGFELTEPSEDINQGSGVTYFHA